MKKKPRKKKKKKKKKKKMNGSKQNKVRRLHISYPPSPLPISIGCDDVFENVAKLRELLQNVRSRRGRESKHGDPKLLAFQSQRGAGEAVLSAVERIAGIETQRRRRSGVAGSY